MPNITSMTKLYTLIGDPVEHSLSPVMHNAAFQFLNLDYVYLAFRVDPKELKQTIAGMRSLGILGFNVTVPHKVSIMKYLDEVNPLAAEIGAVNTVVNKGGRLIGYNTDGAGAVAALEEHTDLHGKRVLLLGAGGAARALAFYLAPLAGSLVIVNRTEATATDLADALNKRFKTASIEGMKLTENVLRRELEDVDILINATSVGMYPNVDETLVNKGLLHPKIVVFDVVYNPLETRLLREAEVAKAKTVNGLKMLAYQGALSFEILTGRKPPVDVMVKTLIEAIGGR